ncbi:MAG: hypothetical protein JNM07_08115 [Phycisphaerae bacterium]|nr:hypothetical protein [Phycisphaerae bacterium]
MPTTEQLEFVKVVLQIGSSLIFAAGLIYTAVQFRHHRRAAHVANFTKLVEMQMQLRRMRVENPALAKVYTHDVLDLRTEDDIRFYFFNLMQLSLFEIAWYSYHQGQLSDAYYRSWESRMRIIASEETFRRMMASPSMKIMHDDFQRYIQRMIAEVSPDPRG